MEDLSQVVRPVLPVVGLGEDLRHMLAVGTVGREVLATNANALLQQAPNEDQMPTGNRAIVIQRLQGADNAGGFPGGQGSEQVNRAKLRSKGVRLPFGAPRRHGLASYGCR